jgi:3-deoxy-7-phosphoheptulonate synthase
MLIVMDHAATPQQVEAVMEQVRACGFRPVPMPGAERTAVCVLGNTGPVNPAPFENLPGVKECIRVTKPYKLVSRETQPQDTVVTVAETPIGGPATPVLIAGPCSVESRDQMFRTVEFLVSRGVKLIRGGVFKPRTSPYAFQGLGEKGLEILAEIKQQFPVGVVTEALDHENFNAVEPVADMIQIGARNMQNFSLLRRAGESRKPILLKRGLAATLEELLMAAEYILAGGNRQVVVCERGVRTFADHTRNTLDLSAVVVVKQLSHLPIVVDPSHAAGKWPYVIPLALAGVAAGAHGLLVEVHPDPARALSDGPQSLTFDKFVELQEKVQRLLAATQQG